MYVRKDRLSARIAHPVAATITALACFLGANRAESQPVRETVVRAPNAEPLEDVAADASVITRDRPQRAEESLPFLLSELPGVTINRTGGAGSLALVSLRGSAWNQVEIYLDGVPLNSGQGGVDVSTIPIGDVDRIEVYRGASPIAFGTSALGGIISITSQPPRKSNLQVEAGVGSFRTYHASVTAAWVSARVRTYAGFHILSTAGNFWFSSDNGTAFDMGKNHEVRRINNAVQQKDGTARVIFSLSPGRELSASTLIFIRGQGLPGYGSVRQTEETALDTSRVIGSVNYDSSRDLGDQGQVHLQAFYSLQQLKFFDPLGEISIAPASTRDTSRTAGLSLRMSKSFAAWLGASAVAEVRYEVFEPFDALASRPAGGAANRLFGGSGLEADAWWKSLRLHVIPSLRLETARDVRSGRNPNGELLPSSAPVNNTLPAARLALVELAADAWTLRSNFGRYGRLPSTFELYGDSGFVLGSPNLLAETGWNGDLGVTWKAGNGAQRFATSATLFGSSVENLIQYQEDGYGRSRAANIGRARIVGVEATFDARLAAWARLLLNATFTDARNVSATSLGAHSPVLPNRPQFHTYGRPEIGWSPRSDFRLKVYLDADLIDGNYLDPANLVALPPRLLFGAGISAEARHFTLVASAQNLSDARTFDFAGFPLPSRSFFLSVSFTQTQGE